MSKCTADMQSFFLTLIALQSQPLLLMSSSIHLCSIVALMLCHYHIPVHSFNPLHIHNLHPLRFNRRSSIIFISTSSLWLAVIYTYLLAPTASTCAPPLYPYSYLYRSPQPIVTHSGGGDNCWWQKHLPNDSSTEKKKKKEMSGPVEMRKN
jgi:hypothetical protein